MQRVGEFSAADILTALFGKEKKLAHVYRQSSNSFVWNSMVFQRLPDLAIKLLFTSGSVCDCIHKSASCQEKKATIFRKSHPARRGFVGRRLERKGGSLLVSGRFKRDFLGRGVVV